MLDIQKVRMVTEIPKQTVKNGNGVQTDRPRSQTPKKRTYAKTKICRGCDYYVGGFSVGSFRLLSGVSLSQQPLQSPLQPHAPPQLHEPPQHSFGSSTGLPPIVGGGGTSFASAKNFSSMGDFMRSPSVVPRSITCSD